MGEMHANPIRLLGAGLVVTVGLAATSGAASAPAAGSRLAADAAQGKSKIAFITRGPQRVTGLYVVSADGSGQRRLTGNVLVRTPAWSPDGRRIAFESVHACRTPGARARCDGTTGIYVANADGSRGAAVTAALAGVEHRIHTFVLESGRGHLSQYVAIFCTALDPAERTARMATLSVVDPVRWLPKARGASVLIQNGAKDTLSPRADVLALYAAARRPKELRWYPASHDLNASATAYRAQWLLRQLGIR